MRVYYTLADWRSKPFLSGSLREHSYLFGGLRSRNYHAVLGKHNSNSRFSLFVFLVAVI